MNLSYTGSVEYQLTSVSLPTLSSLLSTPDPIDFLFGEVTNILLSAVQKHVPAKRFLSFVNPRWKTELKYCHSKSKRIYKECVRADRPRDTHTPRESVTRKLKGERVQQSDAACKNSGVPGLCHQNQQPCSLIILGVAYWWGVTGWNTMQPGSDTETLELLILIPCASSYQSRRVTTRAYPTPPTV